MSSDPHDPESSLTFRWLGTGGIEFRYQEMIVLVDPFLTRPSLLNLFWRPLYPNSELLKRHLPQADLILISHSHYDHIMDVPEIMKYTTAKACGSPQAMQILQRSGVDPQRCQVVQPGCVRQIGHFTITVLPGGHIFVPFFTPKETPPKLTPPRRVWDYQMDSCYSYILSSPKHTILIWHNIHGAGAPPAHLLFLNSEISPSELAILLNRVQPAWVVPIHWDNFFRPLDKPIQPFFHPTHKFFPPIQRVNLQDFVKVVRRIAPAAQVILPTPFEFITIR